MDEFQYVERYIFPSRGLAWRNINFNTYISNIHYNMAINIAKHIHLYREPQYTALSTQIQQLLRGVYDQHYFTPP